VGAKREDGGLDFSGHSHKKKPVRTAKGLGSNQRNAVNCHTIPTALKKNVLLSGSFPLISFYLNRYPRTVPFTEANHNFVMHQRSSFCFSLSC
jgi:hypothetical protein